MSPVAGFLGLDMTLPIQVKQSPAKILTTFPAATVKISSHRQPSRYAI